VTKSDSETSGQSFRLCSGLFPSPLRKRNHNFICKENCLSEIILNNYRDYSYVCYLHFKPLLPICSLSYIPPSPGLLFTLLKNTNKTTLKLRFQFSVFFYRCPQKTKRHEIIDFSNATDTIIKVPQKCIISLLTFFSKFLNTKCLWKQTPKNR